MKKPAHSKKGPKKKKTGTKSESSGELRKPTKLKPLKNKEMKNWKNTLQEEEEEGAGDSDFEMLPEEEDLKFDDLNPMAYDDEEDDGFYDDNY